MPRSKAKRSRGRAPSSAIPRSLRFSVDSGNPGEESEDIMDVDLGKSSGNDIDLYGSSGDDVNFADLLLVTWEGISGSEHEDPAKNDSSRYVGTPWYHKSATKAIMEETVVSIEDIVTNPELYNSDSDVSFNLDDLLNPRKLTKRLGTAHKPYLKRAQAHQQEIEALGREKRKRGESGSNGPYKKPKTEDDCIGCTENDPEGEISYVNPPKKKPEVFRNFYPIFDWANPLCDNGNTNNDVTKSGSSGSPIFDSNFVINTPISLKDNCAKARGKSKIYRPKPFACQAFFK